MSQSTSASEFYRRPSIYLNANEIVTIEDTKSHKLKSIIIPEQLIEKYRYILDQEMEENILKSFTHKLPDAVQNAFGEDMEKHA
jgi:hypothetical protein